MNELEKKIRLNSLLIIYQNLLTSTQKEILTDNLNYDLSISEIAENRNVSRAAVEDAIKKGSKKLEDFEAQLHIFETNTKITELLEILRNSEDKNKNEIIDEIERIIENGIWILNW